MSIDSFATARALVESALGVPTETCGTEGPPGLPDLEARSEDPQFVGHIEVLVSHPWERVGGPAILVDKTTGEVTQLPVLADLDRLTRTTSGRQRSPRRLINGRN